MEQTGPQKLLCRAISVLLRRGCGLSLVVQYCVSNWNWLSAPNVFYSESSDAMSRKKRLGCENLAFLTHYHGLPVLTTQNEHSPDFLSVSSLSQVDLLVPTKVTGIITQGAKDFGHVQFVGSYKVAYSNDGERWNIYQDEKQRKDKVRSFHSPKYPLSQATQV